MESFIEWVVFKFQDFIGEGIIWNDNHTLSSPIFTCRKVSVYY